VPDTFPVLKIRCTPGTTASRNARLAWEPLAADAKTPAFTPALTSGARCLNRDK